MAGYADIEKIEKLLVRGIDECGDAIISIRDVRKAIAQAKTADVQEVRHGRWMYCGKASGHDHMWQCSECLRSEFTKHKNDIKDYPYCHCGALMDGKV